MLPIKEFCSMIGEEYHNSLAQISERFKWLIKAISYYKLFIKGHCTNLITFYGFSST